MSDPAVRCSGSGWKEGSSKAEVTQLICCLKYLRPRGDSSVCLQRKAESVLLCPEKKTSHASFPFKIQRVLTSGRQTLRSLSVDVDTKESTTREDF